MAFYRAQVAIHSDTGLSRDDSVNVFHFKDTVPLVPQDPSDIPGLLDLFYTANPGALANSISDFLSPSCSGFADVKVYDLSDAEPRVPVYEDLISFTAETNAPLPQEVALCLSYRAAPASGTNPARRRGRLYIGPLSVLSIQGVDPGDTVADTSLGRPRSDLLTIIMTAGDELRTNALGTGLTWCVYSPTTLAATSDLDQALVPIDTVSIDDTWDIQRRRGLSASQRVQLP